jgi:hypothetical protein
MALKFKIASYMATFAGALTIFLTLLYGARLGTVFFRGFLTLVLFFAIGYAIGMFVEFYMKKTLEEIQTKGNNIDITDEPDSDILYRETTSGDIDDVPEFKPLTSDSLMNYSTLEK